MHAHTHTCMHVHAQTQMYDKRLLDTINDTNTYQQ